jgi:hypothetical protein
MESKTVQLISSVLAVILLVVIVWIRKKDEEDCLIEYVSIAGFVVIGAGAVIPGVYYNLNKFINYLATM